MPTPPTSQLSWLQQIMDVDPDWSRLYQRPIVYEFSNGRTFQWRPDVYTTTGT